MWPSPSPVDADQVRLSFADVRLPAYRSVLLRFEIRPAGRLSRRKYDIGEITKREPCFVVSEPGPGTPVHGCCTESARERLAQARARHVELESERNSAS
jgi:hypothetical protein